MRLLLAAVLTAAVGGAASAAPLFSDNFGTGGAILNWNGGANWNVSAGTVDLIGDGTGFQYLPVGNGRYVDLDGTSNNAGVFSTDMTFGPGTYLVGFSLAGSQVGGSSTETVTISLGNWSTTISNIPSGQPLTNYSFLATTTTSGSLSFSNAGGDNIGALLDNVSVSATPEPVSLLVFGGLVAGGGWLARRRMKAAVA